MGEHDGKSSADLVALNKQAVAEEKDPAKAKEAGKRFRVVFVGKLMVFTDAWDGGLIWLVVLAAVNTVASLFYYLRWIRAALRPAAQRGEGAGTGTGTDGTGGRGAPTAALVAAFATVVMGLTAGPLWLILT